MSMGGGGALGSALPAGFRAVPVQEGDCPLRVCVLVREKPHAAHGRLVVIRETLDGRVLLGCVSDAAGRIQRWLEITIQDPGAAAGAGPVFAGAATKEALSERWARLMRAWQARATGPAPIFTGAESKPLAPSPDLASLVPAGGLALVRPRADVSLEGMIDLLSSDPATGALRLSPLPEAESAPLQLLGDSGLLSSSKGKWARAAEVLHLKLRLLTDAVAAASAAVAEMGTPLLNLTADSFRVELGTPGEGLPLLWTGRTVLADAGDALSLPLPGAEEEYYIRWRPGTSVYAPDSAGRAVQGTASLRIRKLEPAGAHGAVIVSGTFGTSERIRPAASDLVWVRLHAGGERVDLYARLETEQGLAAGEWRFRTVPQKHPDAGRRGLDAAQGVSISDAPFQVIPLLSTPCDLYSLAVLAVRVLLVGGGNTIAEAVDETLSLARTLATGESKEPLAARITAALKKDSRWTEALGPHRIAHGLGTAAAALDAVPLELWTDVLAAIIRLFPGASPESHCADLGDAPPAGLQSVFDGPLRDLRSLVARTRGLVIVDWSANREVHSLIRTHRAGLAPGAPRTAAVRPPAVEESPKPAARPGVRV